MLHAKGETIHRVTAVPSEDKSTLKEEEVTKKPSSEDGTKSTS